MQGNPSEATWQPEWNSVAPTMGDPNGIVAPGGAIDLVLIRRLSNPQPQFVSYFRRSHYEHSRRT